MDNVPQIILAGKPYAIPKMATRQLRQILPKAMKLMGELGPMMQAAAGLKNGTDLTTEERVALIGQVNLSEASFELLLDIVQVGVSRATPGFTRAVMDEEVIELGELLAALPVIMAQTGMMSAPAGGGTSAGEAPPPETPSM